MDRNSEKNGKEATYLQFVHRGVSTLRAGQLQLDFHKFLTADLRKSRNTLNILYAK